MNRLFETIRRFANEFCTSDLYDTGFGLAVESCGMRDAETEADMLRALAYMTGFAHGCRLACEYMTPAWRIAHLMGIAAGTLRIFVEEGDVGVRAERAIVTYRAELMDLLKKKEEEALRAG